MTLLLAGLPARRGRALRGLRAGPGALPLLLPAARRHQLRALRGAWLALAPLPRAPRGRSRHRGRRRAARRVRRRDEKAHSALLYGVFRIEQWLGTPGNGSIAVALAGTVGARGARRLLGPHASGGVGRDRARHPVLERASRPPASSSTRRTHAPCGSPSCPPIPRGSTTPSVGDVSLLRNIAGVRGGAFQQLFWNRSVKELLLMPGAPEIDPFRADRVQVADDGSLHGRRARADRRAARRRPRGHDPVLGRRQGRLGAGLLALPPRRAARASRSSSSRRYDDGWMGDQRDDQPLAPAGQRPPRGHARLRPRVAASARSDDGSTSSSPAAASCTSAFRPAARRPSGCPSARRGRG